MTVASLGWAIEARNRGRRGSSYGNRSDSGIGRVPRLIPVRLRCHRTGGQRSSAREAVDGSPIIDVARPCRRKIPSHLGGGTRVVDEQRTVRAQRGAVTRLGERLEEDGVSALPLTWEVRARRPASSTRRSTVSRSIAYPAGTGLAITSPVRRNTSTAAASRAASAASRAACGTGRPLSRTWKAGNRSVARPTTGPPGIRAFRAWPGCRDRLRAAAHDGDWSPGELVQVRRDVIRRRCVSMHAADSPVANTSIPARCAADHRACDRGRSAAAGGDERGQVARTRLDDAVVVGDALELGGVETDSNAPVEHRDDRRYPTFALDGVHHRACGLQTERTGQSVCDQGGLERDHGRRGRQGIGNRFRNVEVSADNVPRVIDSSESSDRDSRGCGPRSRARAIARGLPARRCARAPGFWPVRVA